MGRISIHTHPTPLYYCGSASLGVRPRFYTLDHLVPYKKNESIEVLFGTFDWIITHKFIDMWTKH